MTTVRDRIVVSIYSEEYETVAKALGIKADEISGRTIRVKLGLKETAKTTGINTQIRLRLRENLADMSDEDKAKLLKTLGDKKEEAKESA